MKTGTIYCEFSGHVREAFRARGWDMNSCDLLPSDDDSPHHIQGDAIAVSGAASGDEFAGVHWPCTYFTNSGVRWMYGGKGATLHYERVRLMEESADGLCTLLRRLLAFGTPFYFENPVMHGMARTAIIARLPWFETARRCTIQPWNFGVWETKRTCLWLHKLPPLAVKYQTISECREALGLPLYVGNKLNTPHAACHLASPGPNRGHERSRTLPAIADAIARQWGEYTTYRKTLTLSGTMRVIPMVNGECVPEDLDA